MATPFDLDDVKRRMQGAINAFKHDLGSLRTGRASPSLLDPIQVDAYGSRMPIDPGRDGQRARAAAAQRAGLGPRHGGGGREGDPRIGSRPQPADRGPGHPPAHPGDERAAPQGDGQGRAQIRRGGADRGPPRPPRRARPPQEAREGQRHQPGRREAPGRSGPEGDRSVRRGCRQCCSSPRKRRSCRSEVGPASDRRS